MGMPHYHVNCARCGQPATLKVASQWSDGDTRELKTYAIVCAGCLIPALASARERHLQCRVLPGETVGAPGVWELATGKPSTSLVRRPDLEGHPHPDEPVSG